MKTLTGQHMDAEGMASYHQQVKEVAARRLETKQSLVDYFVRAAAAQSPRGEVFAQFRAPGFSEAILEYQDALDDLQFLSKRYVDYFLSGPARAWAMRSEFAEAIKEYQNALENLQNLLPSGVEI